jgi:hypothetical protein
LLTPTMGGAVEGPRNPSDCMRLFYQPRLCIAVYNPKMLLSHRCKDRLR